MNEDELAVRRMVTSEMMRCAQRQDDAVTHFAALMAVGEEFAVLYAPVVARLERARDTLVALASGMADGSIPLVDEEAGE